MTIAVETYNEVWARGRRYREYCQYRFYLLLDGGKRARFDTWKDAENARNEMLRLRAEN
jgi:hypothetical protein